VLADVLAVARGAGSTWGALLPAAGPRRAAQLDVDAPTTYPSGARYPEVA
jgi:hypothetical protein